MSEVQALAQRREALQRANGIRMAKARFKEHLAGDPECFSRVAAVLEEPVGWEAALRVDELLLALPHVGRVKADKWARACDVGLHRKLRDLPPGKRRRLAWIVMVQAGSQEQAA